MNPAVVGTLFVSAVSMAGRETPDRGPTDTLSPLRSDEVLVRIKK